MAAVHWSVDLVRKCRSGLRLLGKHLLQASKNRCHDGWREATKAFDETLRINRAHLVKRDKAAPPLKLTRDAPRIRAPASGYRRNDSRAEISVQFVWGDDDARPRLANFASQCRIEAHKMDLASMRTGPPYHVHSSSSNLVGVVSSIRPS